VIRQDQAQYEALLAHLPAEAPHMPYADMIRASYTIPVWVVVARGTRLLDVWTQGQHYLYLRVKGSLGQTVGRRCHG
jgi:hypothetical protein